MNRRHFITSLATGALAAPLLAENLTVTLPKPQSAKTSAKTPVVDFDVLLWSIAERETGNRDDAVGPCGSRSKYQISEAVWRQHGMHKKLWVSFTHPHTEPQPLRFETDCRGLLAKRVANEHVAWLDRHLRDTYAWSTYASVYTLAFAWRVGLEGFLRYRGADPDSPAARSALGHGYPYANAVSNLYFARLHSCSATS